MTKKVFRNIVLIWLAWALILIGFQALATGRFKPQFPDRAQVWTEAATGRGYQLKHPFLLDPFMNNQVAWDSEYYLGIATGGIAQVLADLRLLNPANLIGQLWTKR